MQDTFHTDMENLNARFDTLSTSEQFQQLNDRQLELQNSFNTFSESFDGFHQHVHGYFPAPMPPAQFFPHPPYYPPPPPHTDDDQLGD